MRTLLVATFIVFVTSCANAQSNPSETNENNLYSLALKASILQMDKEWGHLGHSALDDEIKTTTDYRHMLVRKDGTITDDLPTAYGDHSIDFVDDQELIDRYQKLNKSFAVLRIAPIRNRGNVLKIVVSTYWFSYKQHRLEFAYSDWSDVEFRYDCGRDAFVLSAVKLGGI